jgi:hypothetical protein
MSILKTEHVRTGPESPLIYKVLENPKFSSFGLFSAIV